MLIYKKILENCFRQKTPPSDQRKRRSFGCWSSLTSSVWWYMSCSEACCHTIMTRWKPVVKWHSFERDAFEIWNIALKCHLSTYLYLKLWVIKSLISCIFKQKKIMNKMKNIQKYQTVLNKSYKIATYKAQFHIYEKYLNIYTPCSENKEQSSNSVTVYFNYLFDPSLNVCPCVFMFTSHNTIFSH